MSSTISDLEAKTIAQLIYNDIRVYRLEHEITPKELTSSYQEKETIK